MSEGWEPVPSGDQPAFGAWNTVGGQWRWSQIHCRRSPGPRSGALVDSRRRGPVEPAGRPAVEHGPGRNRPRRPHFTRPERTGCTRADPEAATTVHPDRTRRRRHELPPAVRRSDARHHSGGSATETNIRPSIPTDDRHRMFPAAGSGCRDVRRDAVLVRAYLCWRPARSGVPAVGPRCDRPVGLSDRRLRYLACTARRHRAPRPPERVNAALSVREQHQLRQAAIQASSTV